MNITFSIQNSFELRTVVDSLTFAFNQISEGKLFTEDDTLTKIMRGLAVDRIADDMVGNYNDNKASAEFSVVATDLSHDNNGVYDHIECEYCQNRKDVENAIQLFLDKGFSEEEISVKRLNYCSPRHDNDDDIFFDDDNPTILNDDDLDDDCFTDFSDDDT